MPGQGFNQKQSDLQVFIQLMRELRSYGLNPRDWRFERQSILRGGWIEMHHRDDFDFRVRGNVARAENGRTYWQTLSLASI